MEEERSIQSNVMKELITHILHEGEIFLCCLNHANSFVEALIC